MFRKIVIALVLLLGIFGTCYAEDWKELNNYSIMYKSKETNFSFSIDIDSIRSMVLNNVEITKVRTKRTNNDTGEYTIFYYHFNSDTKAYRKVLSESYTSSNKMIDSIDEEKFQLDFYGKVIWEKYNPNYEEINLIVDQLKKEGK